MGDGRLYNRLETGLMESSTSPSTTTSLLLEALNNALQPFFTILSYFSHCRYSCIWQLRDYPTQ